LEYRGPEKPLMSAMLFTLV